jgi:mannose-6-phosphate isomerase-like protein (cupin superfamily)
MTDAVRRAAAAAVLAVAFAGCSAPRTPPPVAPRRPAQSAPTAESLRDGGAPALKPYLEQYPLGESGLRIDCLGTTEERSIHLVQAKRGIGRHIHPARTETIYVLTGTGTCYVGDRSYPIRPGSTFRIAPGTPHSALPDAGSTIVAVAYFEPPLGDEDDRVPVEEGK